MADTRERRQLNVLVDPRVREQVRRTALAEGVAQGIIIERALRLLQAQPPATPPLVCGRVIR